MHSIAVAAAVAAAAAERERVRKRGGGEIKLIDSSFFEAIIYNLFILFVFALRAVALVSARGRINLLVEPFCGGDFMWRVQGWISC